MSPVHLSCIPQSIESTPTGTYPPFTSADLSANAPSDLSMSLSYSVDTAPEDVYCSGGIQDLVPAEQTYIGYGDVSVSFHVPSYF